MAYPDDIDKFIGKLNKLDNNNYVMEECIEVTNGVYEGELGHDNVSLSSINVYTGSKLTGTKIDNVIISTPSLTPWKKNIKIYSSVSPVYISYETIGDTVEADDINKVQDSIVSTQKEVDRYKSSNDTRLTQDENRITTVENNKAEKTYVDTELNKRYLKTETYTKEETDQRIQMVVNAAPAALDTLKEIADALNDDPNFAATITTELSKKVDKVDGKQLSTEDYTTTEKQKLAGIQDNANNYVHPETHPSSMITGLSKVGTSNDYNDLNNRPTIPTSVSQLNNDSEFVTQSQLGSAGYGDMLKSTYDTNNNGKADNADNADTVDGKHANNFINYDISRPTNVDLNNYASTGAWTIGSISANGPNDANAYWGTLIVTVSADVINQLLLGINSELFYRSKTGGGGWTAWKTVLTTSKGITWNDLKGV